MDIKERNQLKIGDKIRFRAMAMWARRPTEKRSITHRPDKGEFMYPQVGITFGGYRPYWVLASEIIEVIKDE
jgi:hypothetical protein